MFYLTHLLVSLTVPKLSQYYFRYQLGIMLEKISLPNQIQNPHSAPHSDSGVLGVSLKWKLEVQKRGQSITIGTKVIIQKSHREVSPVEQYSIDCEFLAYLKFITKSERFFFTFFTFILCNFLVQTLQYYLKKIRFFFCP